MEPIRFSIIVPIYNIAVYQGDNLFKRCVESLLKQTYNNIEIILVDDGSIDDAPILCDKYARDDSRVVVIHKANGGVSSARNMGLRWATGDYIIFVDADDEIDIHSCEVFANIIRRHPDIEVISADARVIKDSKTRYMRFISKGDDKVMAGGEFLKEQLSHRTFHSIDWSYITNRAFLKDNLLFFKEDIYINEDNEWCSRLLLSAKKVINSCFIYYHYRILETSGSNPKDNKDKFLGTIQYCEALEKRFTLIDDEDLRSWMMSFIFNLWLSSYEKGSFYKKRYNHIINKGFLTGKPRLFIEIVKYKLFSVSPFLYCQLTRIVRKMKWAI